MIIRLVYIQKFEEVIKMKELQITIISPSGKVTTQKDIVAIWITPESYVRGVMYWYGNNTRFIVQDDTGEIQAFMRVYMDDIIKGYTELIRLNINNLNDLFDILARR